MIMNKISTFVENNTCNLRSGMQLSRVNRHCTQYSMKSISNLGTKIWNLVLVHIKDFKARRTIRNQIKK